MVALYRLLVVVSLAVMLGGCAGSNSPARARLLTPVALPPQMRVAEASSLSTPAIPERSSSPRSVALPAASTDQVGASPARPALSASPMLPSSPLAPVPPVLLTGQPWPSTWTNVWVPLETWARLNKLAQPVQLTTGPDAGFAVHTASGPIRLKLGSQVVHLLGHDCLIAFPPRTIGGVPYLHSLDLQKTLQPMLTGSYEFPATNRVIVIDAGHGGRDSGTKNGFGTDNEKVFTLDWARRLEAILVNQGWTVVMTRTNDIDLPLAERVSIADRARADLFLSLHFNSGAQHPDLNGLETYCLTPSGLPSNLRRDFEDDPREVHPNNAHDQSNFLLATRLHRTLLKVTGAHDRGVRRARFMTVLRNQNRPAVLIEGGFLSNPSESRRIATASYRQLLAEAVAQAVNEPGTSLLAASVPTSAPTATASVSAAVTASTPTASNSSNAAAAISISAPAAPSGISSP